MLKLMQFPCAICNAPMVEGSRFCKCHQKSFEQLELAFAKWKLAYSGQLEWKAFLERLLQLSETGQKVREVIRLVLEEESV